MDLRTDYPYWLLRHGIVRSYPSLQQNIHTEVVVMGAGISGALAAWYLQKAGIQVTLVDRRHAGMGSTAATTALLQYEIDVPLRQLIKKVGEYNAVRSYLLCLQSIYDLQKITRHVREDAEFLIKPSFQYASSRKDLEPLHEEYELRKKTGIEVQWLEEKEVKSHFGFSKPAGILSKTGAEVNAYSLTHALLKNGLNKGISVYDHTDIINIQHRKRSVELQTADGYTITAKKLVIACGYESLNYIPFKIETLYSTYAIASEPLTDARFWYKNALIWETAVPYLYMRVTGDRRILIGGKDDLYTSSAKRDRMLPAKARMLEQAFGKLFPSVPFKTDFKWAGIFGSTKDGLPYIGSIAQHPNTYFALGFGGNGITFSVLAAQIIRDAITGVSNPDARLFSFDR